MKIRVINPGEAAAYRDLWLRALRDSPAAFPTNNFKEESLWNVDAYAARLQMEEERGKIILGAFEGASLVAILGFERLQDPKFNHQINLFGFYVDPAHRKKGIGRALINEAIERARGMAGIRYARLCVFDTPDSALPLYQKMGFKIFGVEKGCLCFNENYYDLVCLGIYF